MTRDAPLSFLLVIPAQAGLRRRDAEATIRIANGPKGVQQEQHVIQSLQYLAEALDPGLRRDDGLFRRSLGIPACGYDRGLAPPAATGHPP